MPHCFFDLVKKDLDKIKSDLPKIRTGVDNIVHVLHKNSDFYGYRFNTPWYDIGSVEELKNARKHFTKEK